MKKVLTFFSIALFCILFQNAKAQTVGLFKKDTAATDGYVLFSPNSYPAHYLINKCGKLINRWTVSNVPGLDAFLLPNHNLLLTGKVSNPYFTGTGTAGGLIQIRNWGDSLLWSYTISDSIYHQDHDIFPMPNGNILVCIWERHTKADAIAMGKDTAGVPAAIWSTKVEEIQPIGTDSAAIVWQWNLWDHLIQDYDSTKPNFGIVAGHPELMNLNFNGSGALGNAADWTHANAVTYNSDLDQIMISSRNLSEIWIIDHSTTTAEAATHKGGKHGRGGDFLYRWGNPQAYNRGTAADEQLFVQHNPTWIPKGYPDENKIMVFNDGTGRPGGNYSSVDVFTPPADANGDYKLDSGAAYGPAKPYWSYTAPNPTDFYSSVQGGAQRLMSGHTLITESTKGNFFEVDSAKNIVWRYVNPVGPNGPIAQSVVPKSNAVFRANQYEPDYVAFQSLNLVEGNPIEIDPNYYDCSTNTAIKKPAYQNRMFTLANPFGQSISIYSNAAYANTGIVLYDISGRQVANWQNLQFQPQLLQSLDVPGSLKPGIYILKIETAGETQEMKLIHD